MKRISTFLFFVNLFSLAQATTFITNSSGHWNNPVIWSPNGIPDVGDDVIISSGHTVTVSASQITSSLTVNQGGNLTMQAGRQLTIMGDLTVNGFFTMNDGNILFPTQGANFIIGPAGSFTWQPGNNTAADATLFINGIENFAPSSTLIIKKWYNYMGVPLGSVVSGNFGNLILNSKSGNVVYEWNQNNQFSIHQVIGTLTVDEGWITLDKSSSISNVTIGNIVLSTPNAYLLFHSGTHNSTITINTSSIQNYGGTIWGIYNGNGNLNLNVAGNFTNSGNIKLLFNDGIPNVGNGNVLLSVNQSFTQSAGDFRAIYNVTTSNSGIYEMTFKNLTVNGGVFFGQYGCHTGGLSCKLTVTEALTLNMTTATDKFRGIGLTSLSGNINNASFLFNAGSINISGNNSAEFTTNAAQSLETNNIGSFLVNGCDVNFNYGTNTAAHEVNLLVSGVFSMTGGSLNLSRLAGNLTATFNHNFSITGGTLSFKRSEGDAVVNLNRNFTQSGGEIYFRNSSTLISSTPVSFTVNGSFTHSAGTLSFGNDISGNGISTLNLNGNSVNLSGTGQITKTTINNNYGILNYSRSGATSFNRSGTLHTINKVKQIINSGTTLDVISGNLQLSAAPSGTNDMLQIQNNARLNMRTNQITSSLLLPYSGLRVYSGGTLATQNTNGLYNMFGSACINNAGNMNFYLDANSTVEYNGTSNQTITGLSGTAATMNHKYGKLNINFQGTPDVDHTLLAANVYVRTQLILTTGELNLNSNTLTIESGSSVAINRVNGYIKSESISSTNNSKIRWRFMTSGNHTFPFGVNSSNYIPVTFNVLSGAGNEVTISTRATGADNLPLPSSTLTGPVTGLILNDPQDAQSKVIDRYWDINCTGITADVTLSYRGAENTLDPTLKNSTLIAKYWNGTAWIDLNGTAGGITSGIGSLTVSSTNLYSSWIIATTVNTPLPIKLLSFTATPVDKRVRLNWETATEINNEFFTVERSSDGINFDEIAIVKGAGDSNNILKYTSWDDNPLYGISYYRLKQTDYDGKFSYSQIVSVNMNNNSGALLEIKNLSPNPFNNNFEIVFNTHLYSNIEFELINLQGQKVFKDKITVENGKNSYLFDKGADLPSGTYIALLRSNGVTETKKIIKK